MAELPDKIKKTVYAYLTALKRNNIPIKEAVLFGSYATGKNHEWSDIDIALVSNLFVGNRMDDKDKIRDITLSVSCDLEVLPYRPEDFTFDDPFVKEIVKTGIKLI